MVYNLELSRYWGILAEFITKKGKRVWRNVWLIKEFGKAHFYPFFFSFLNFDDRLLLFSVYEVAFWDPTDDQPLARTSRAPSCPDFIEWVWINFLSIDHFFLSSLTQSCSLFLSFSWISVVDNYTLLLHQGLIERSFLDEVEARRPYLPSSKQSRAPHGNVFRPYEFETCSTDTSSSSEYPVSATFSHGETKEKFTVRAKYLLGVDGARSLVRRAISGGGEGDGEYKGKINMLGDASDIIWGVMDVEVWVFSLSLSRSLSPVFTFSNWLSITYPFLVKLISPISCRNV